MKQTPLTNMENRWVHSTKEAFDALVEMGYEPYTGKYLGYKKLEVVRDWIIFQVSTVYSTSKQAYYHNGHFYDQPYEEFTITEEKVPFPELEDIEWVMVEAPEYLGRQRETVISGIIVPLNRKVNSDSIDEIAMSHWHIIKTLHENSKDFKVTWKLKEKINRKLHENRPLALAIGRGLLEGIIISDSMFFNLGAVKVNNVGKLVFHYGDYWEKECTLHDDYIIPDQVLQWMKEYQKDTK